MQKENLKENKQGISLDDKKEYVKVGLSASLAATVISSFFLRNNTARLIHIGAGVALAGLSLWHHLLYEPKKKEKKS